MDRIDRLLLKAIPRPTPVQRLQKDNPYIGKSRDELLDYLSGDNYRAPEMHTPEWDRFIYAVVHAGNIGGLRE